MATNLRSRLERLEQRTSNGASIPLIIVTLLGVEENADYTGVSVNDEFVPCRLGQSAPELKDELIAGIERQGRCGLFTVFEA